MSSAIRSSTWSSHCMERERRTRERIDKSRGNAVALGMPFVFCGDGAADAVEAGIECAVAVERAHQTAEQRGNGDGIVEPRAAVGNAQFDGRVRCREGRSAHQI